MNNNENKLMVNLLSEKDFHKRVHYFYVQLTDLQNRSHCLLHEIVTRVKAMKVQAGWFGWREGMGGEGGEGGLGLP